MYVTDGDIPQDRFYYQSVRVPPNISALVMICIGNTLCIMTAVAFLSFNIYYRKNRYGLTIKLRRTCQQFFSSAPNFSDLIAYSCGNTNLSTTYSVWAATWQNQQNDCAPSENSDQPGHPPSLIRVFAVHMKKARVLSYPMSAQRILWCPGWSESSLGAHTFCWFCHVAAHLLNSFNLYSYSCNSQCNRFNRLLVQII